MVNNQESSQDVKKSGSTKKIPDFLGGPIESPCTNLRVNPEISKDEGLPQVRGKVFSSTRGFGRPKKCSVISYNNTPSITFKKSQQNPTDIIIQKLQPSPDNSDITPKEKLPIFCATESLSGHLRIQPDRACKGSHSASLLYADVSSESDDYVEKVSEERVVDLADLLKSGWKVKGGRGRKNVGPTYSELATSSKGKGMAVQSAANTLVPRGTNLTAEKVNNNNNSNNNNGVQELVISDGLLNDNCNCNFCKRSRIDDVIHENNGERERSLSNDGPLSQMGVKMVWDMGENAESPLNRKVGEGAGNHKKYRCNTCDISFLTYKALGGHMSNHKKKKKKFQAVIQDTTMDIVTRLRAQVGQESEEHEKRGGYTSADGPLSQVASLPSKESSNIPKAVHHHIINLENNNRRGHVDETEERGKCLSADGPLGNVAAPGKASEMCRRGSDFDLNEKLPSEDESGFGPGN